MRTPDEVFIDFKARKNGILSALCEDQDSFFSASDPASENLCLYGNPDGSWVGIRSVPFHRPAVEREPAIFTHDLQEVALPAEEVPPEAPEPALGINFARDGMVSLIQLGQTVQARPMGRMDASAARLRAGEAGLAEPGGGAQRLLAAGPGVLQRGSPEPRGPVRAGPHPQPRHLPAACCRPGRLRPVCTRREALFCLINAEPTCYEVVSGKVVRDGKAKKRGAPGQPAMRQPVPNPPLKAQRPVRGGPPNPSWACFKTWLPSGSCPGSWAPPVLLSCAVQRDCTAPLRAGARSGPC